MDEILLCAVSSTSSAPMVTFSPLACSTTSAPSPLGATSPEYVLPSVVMTVWLAYWSEMTWDGWRIDSRISFFWNRLLTLLKSGPTVSPRLP